MGHKVVLAGKHEAAQGIVTFEFEKPAGFNFKAGQFVDLVLPGEAEPARPQDQRHAFTLSSAPHETRLAITTRVRETTYKQTLYGLALGSELEIEGPYGMFNLHTDPARAAVMIAGGIGVTPFISMLRQATQQAFSHDLALIYANRRPEETAFLQELQQLQAKQPRFHLLVTMTNAEDSAQAWSGPRQPLDVALVQQTMQGLHKPIFYVSGPPAMVESLRRQLMDIGIDEADLRNDEFYGY